MLTQRSLSFLTMFFFLLPSPAGQETAWRNHFPEPEVKGLGKRIIGGGPSTERGKGNHLQPGMAEPEVTKITVMGTSSLCSFSRSQLLHTGTRGEKHPVRGLLVHTRTNIMGADIPQCPTSAEKKTECR